MTTTVALQLASNNSAGENEGSFIFHSIDILLNQAAFQAQGRQQKIKQTKIPAFMKPTFYRRETDH